MNQAPTVGPIAMPRYVTPAKREKIVAREPEEVQSLTYADVADCKAPGPPSRPSTKDASRRNWCP